MKKYLSILILFGLLLVPVMSKAQVSSTVEKRVVPRAVPVLKKSYETAVKQSPAVSSAPRSVLKQGMKGEDVRYMQAWLYNQGYDIDIDGVFGPGTKGALVSFQKSTNGALGPDGVFGPLTALYVQGLPTGVAVKSLDEGTIKYLKGKQIATISGKEVTTKTITASSKVKTAPKATSKSVIAKLPKDVKSVLAKALPKTPTLTPVQVATGAGVSATTPKTVTKKPKAAIAELLSKSKVSLVTSGNTTNNLVASANLNTNFSKGEAGKATGEYICAEFSGDNMCAAVSAGIAAAIKAGQLDAKDVLAEILSNDGSCPFCSTNENGGLVLTSGAGGVCGGGGGPGSGEFITPPSNPVPGTPACIPKSEVLNQKLNIVATADNVFTAYIGYKNADGIRTFKPVLKDMNWYEDTATSANETLGWKSAESVIGLTESDPTIDGLYIAINDDNWVTAALLAHVQWGEGDYVTGVSPDYEVMVSSVDGPVHPNEFSITELASQISSGTWMPSKYVASNGDSPWGFISLNGSQPNLDSAKWLYENSAYNTNKPLIYRLKVCDEEVPTITDSCMDFRVDANNIATLGTGHYRVEFNETVVVSGIPELRIQKDASAPIVKALFTGFKDADHKVLEFTAQINAGPNAGVDSPFYVGTGTINLVNGSTIKNTAGQNATLTPVTFSATDLCPPTTEICIDYPPGLGINYTVTFPGAITVTGNDSDIKMKIVKANGDIIYGNYTGPSAGGNGMHFILNPGTPYTPSAADFVGTATLVLSNGATVKNAQGVPVNTYLGVFTADDKCTAAEYRGVIQVDSITTKEVTQVATTGGYNNGPKKKLLIKVKFKSSQDGNPNAYVFGTPAIYLQKDDTTDLGARATYVEGNGTTELTFEHVSNAQNYPDAKYDFTVYNHLEIDTSTGSIHTLANNGWSYWFANLLWFNEN